MSSHKSPKIAALIADCQGHPRFDAHYLGYFKCFNQQLYYEAHDVLEELWLADKHGPLGNFYKGLIQFAGAFVHLQKNRLAPAGRLFALATKNLSAYPSPHEGLDVARVLHLAGEHVKALEQGQFERNPWSLQKAPKIGLD
jgi:predicted metal-dependent hydrolase